MLTTEQVPFWPHENSKFTASVQLITDTVGDLDATSFCGAGQLQGPQVSVKLDSLQLHCVSRKISGVMVRWEELQFHMIAVAVHTR